MPVEKTISILGLKGAGKSTYLAVLNLALARDKSPWRIRPVGQTIAIMSSVMHLLYNKGLYPDATTVETEMEFVVEKDASKLGLLPGAQFRLKTADVPGEAVKGVSSVDAIYHDFYQTYLKGCNGIVFLLDYKHKWREGQTIDDESADIYFPLFSSILAEIREQADTNPYVVFCVTKADLIEGQGPNSKFDNNGYFDGVEDVAQEILGINTKALIDQTFDRDHIYWLPVSATGFTGEGSKRVSQFIEKTEGSGIKNPKELKPIGIAESLEWVLDKLADDDEDVRIARTRGRWYADVLKGIRNSLGL